MSLLAARVKRVGGLVPVLVLVHARGLPGGAFATRSRCDFTSRLV